MNRLSVRLSIAFLISAWLGIGVMAFVVQRSFDASFRRYLNNRDNPISSELVTRLEQYYTDNGSWAGVQPILSGRGVGSGNGNGAGRGATFTLIAHDEMIVAASDEGLIGTAAAEALIANALALRVNGEQVGWLARQSPGIQALGATEVAFLDESNRWLAIAGGTATLLALLVGGALAWTLARPLRELTIAARDLTVGQLGRQVNIRGTSEVNALADEFNIMSKALQETESARQRMAADVAHELRTPVSVLRGHLEALLDGLYPLDNAHISVAHDQTIHLARLVEDLRVLTLAEAKRLPLERAAQDPATLLNGILESFEPLVLDAEIRLTRQIPLDLPPVLADITRLRQVLSNLLTNALRHTPAGGEIRVAVAQQGNLLHFSVSNTGSLQLEDRERVFQPFWRSEAAREQDKSGSGLGLAISREIIMLHGGTFTVTSKEQQVTFTFTLPLV